MHGVILAMRSSAEQHEFNVRRWAELVADSAFAAVPNKIETDADGKIIMSPPADSDHGDRQAEIAYQLKRSLPKGRVITECGVSTSAGTKVPDVVWLSSQHPQVLKPGVLVTKPAPEICIEILSPDNTAKEIREKTALYFEAGAREVWICDLEGKMRCLSPASELSASPLFPEFPKLIHTYAQKVALEREKDFVETEQGEPPKEPPQAGS
jgi:Uma2 family endonuclease